MENVIKSPLQLASYDLIGLTVLVKQSAQNCLPLLKSNNTTMVLQLVPSKALYAIEYHIYEYVILLLGAYMVPSHSNDQFMPGIERSKELFQLANTQCG